MTGPVAAQVRHSSMAPCLVRGARVLDGAPDGALERDVFLADGKVVAVAPKIDVPRGVEVVEASGLRLLPGWIDLQVNDVDWISRGLKDPREHAERIRDVAAHQAARGVTGLVLATLAAPLEEVIAYLRGMKLVLDGPARPTDAVFLGGLVEGTFMNPALSGAHNPAHVLRPSREVLDRLLDTGAVRLINLAPETSPDAIELIAHAASRGAVVGAGHAKPHAERLREAVRAGLRYAIHLGNGPTGSSLKRFHDGGMLEEVLRNDGIVATIILDGWHVHPQLARDWIARKEADRVALVSDAGFAMGAPRGEFEAFGVRGATSEEGEYLKVLPRPGAAAPNPLSSDASTLFGAAVGMREVFENAVNLLVGEMAGVYHRRHPALGLDGAVRAASRMCSATPARLLGLADRGEVRPGARSDVILIEIDGPPGRSSVRVDAVWVG